MPVFGAILLGLTTQAETCTIPPTQGALWRSTDAGNTWQPLFFRGKGGANNSWIGPVEIRTNNVVGTNHVFYALGAVVDYIRNPATGACSLDASTYSTQLYRTDDDGDNWTQVSTPFVANTQGGLGNILDFAVSGNTIFAGGSPSDVAANTSGKNFVFRSQDGGLTWQPLSACLPSDAPAVYKIALTAQSVFIAVPVRYQNGLLYKHSEIYQLDLCSLSPPPIAGTTFKNVGELSSSSHNDKETQRLKGEMLPLSKMLIKTAPNPAMNELQIEVGLPNDAQVHIKLLDMLGNTVLVAHDGYFSQGWHSLSVNVSQLASGQYICVIESGQQRARTIVTIFK